MSFMQSRSRKKKPPRLTSYLRTFGNVSYKVICLKKVLVWSLTIYSMRIRIGARRLHYPALMVFTRPWPGPSSLLVWRPRLTLQTPGTWPRSSGSWCRLWWAQRSWRPGSWTPLVSTSSRRSLNTRDFHWTCSSHSRSNIHPWHRIMLRRFSK